MINPPQGCDDRVRGSHRIAIESEQSQSRGRSLTKFLSLVETNSVFETCGGPNKDVPKMF